MPELAVYVRELGRIGDFGQEGQRIAVVVYI